MEEITPMNGRQADFFDRLKEVHGFRPSDLIRYCDMSESTATRKFRGETTLTEPEIHQLIARHPDTAVRCDIAEYVVSHTGITFLALPTESPNDDIGEDTAETLELVAQFIRERAEHIKDGVIEPHERERQEELVRQAGRAVHSLLQDVCNQKVTIRQKAKPLKFGGAA